MPSSGTLTKAHIVDSVIEDNGFTRRKAAETIETLLEIKKSKLESGEDVKISGFEHFCLKQKAERRGRNPANGEDMMIGRRKLVTFKCSGKLREKMDDG